MLLAEAYREAVSLKNQHGLLDWRVIFIKSKTVLGYCGFTTKSIALSTSFILIDNRKEFVDTVLHEIAHAFCGLEAMHGKKWLQKFKSIGGTGLIDAPKANSPRNDRFHLIVTCNKCKRRWVVSKKQKYLCTQCGHICDSFLVYGTRNQLQKKFEVRD